MNGRLRAQYDQARTALLADPTLANPWVVEAPWGGFPFPPDIRIISFGEIAMSFRLRTDPGNEDLVHIYSIQHRPGLANGAV